MHNAKMIKRADLGLITLFCSLDKLGTLLRKFKSGARSAKLTVRAELGLKTLFWTN